MITLFVALMAFSTAFQLQTRLLNHQAKSLNLQMMANKIFMPALSSVIEEGKVVSWMKKVGDKISLGDVILAIESDKIYMDVESFGEGYLASILVNEGESANVGSPVAVLVKSLKDIRSSKAPKKLTRAARKKLNAKQSKSRSNKRM
jgi:pyruvate dehydrogenase E2 component (dihydrolipoamide acetyltransferase)